MLLGPLFPYYAIIAIKTGFLLFLLEQQLSTIMKLKIFVESPEYQAVDSEVPNFSSEYPELQNTNQQEIPPYFIEILVSPSLLIKLMTPY